MEIDILLGLIDSDPDVRATVFEKSLKDSLFRSKISCSLLGSKEVGMYLDITIDGDSFEEVVVDLTSILNVAKKLKGGIYDGELRIATPKIGDTEKLLIIFEEFDNNWKRKNAGQHTPRNENKVFFTIVFN